MAKKQNNNVLYFILFGVLLIILFGYNIFLTFFTKFEKEITVKSKYIRNSSKGRGKYYIVDTNNNAYIISDNMLLLQFNKTDDYNLVNVNQKYKVYGYGFRIQFLSMYPKIYDLKKV